MASAARLAMESLQRATRTVTALSADLALIPRTPENAALYCLTKDRLERATVWLADCLADVDETSGLKVSPLPLRQERPVRGRTAYDCGGGRRVDHSRIGRDEASSGVEGAIRAMEG